MKKRFEIDAWVRTNKILDASSKWIDGAGRRPNEVGKVVTSHDSHGLCYGVEHGDGRIAYYDHEELAAFKKRPRYSIDTAAVPGFAEAATLNLNYLDNGDIQISLWNDSGKGTLAILNAEQVVKLKKALR
jgi:hypothetical protein